MAHPAHRLFRSTRLRLVLGVLILAACDRAAPPRAAESASAAPDTSRARQAPTAAVLAVDTPTVGAPADTLTSLVVDSAATEPRLEAVDGAYVLWLPESMYDALLATAPGFETLRRRDYTSDVRQFVRNEALFAVVGDFDGDRRKDVVVNGSARSELRTHAL